MANMVIGPDATKCGIQKKIVYPGHGDIPEMPLDTKILFHFRTQKCDDSKTVIDDTKQKNEPFELIIGKKFKLECWELCLKTMRINEVSQFTVNKSFLHAYPIVSKQLRDIARGVVAQKHCCGMMALSEVGLGYADLEELLKQPQDLDFIFELLKVTLPGEYQKEQWAMSESEKMDRIPELQEEGNKLYKKGLYETAAEKYSEALSSLEQLSLREKPGDVEFLAIERGKIPFLLNLAQCQLSMEDFYPVVGHTSEVLKLDPDNVKALYRRAKAHSAMWNFCEAREDFIRVAKLDPSLARAVQREIVDMDEREKKKDAEDRSHLEGKLFT